MSSSPAPASIDDVPAIGALVRRAEAHDRVPRVLADEELADDLSASYIDLDLDTRVAERDGEVVGWAQVWHPEAPERLDRADLFGEVAPDHRGRDRPRPPRLERRPGEGAAGGHDPRAPPLHPARRPRLARGPPPPLPAVRLRGRAAGTRCCCARLIDLPRGPDAGGVRLEPWPETDEETLVVRNTTFGDHWGSTRCPPEVWDEVVRGHGGRPELSFVAVDESTGGSSPSA